MNFLSKIIMELLLSLIRIQFQRKTGICNTDKAQDEWVKIWLLGRFPKDNCQQGIITEWDFSLMKSNNEWYWAATS